MLVRIEEPKTQARGAKHQAAKIEAEDLVKIIVLAFPALPPTEKLWPMSPQTLRKRFDVLLQRVGASPPPANTRALDLGSFRRSYVRFAADGGLGASPAQGTLGFCPGHGDLPAGDRGINLSSFACAGPEGSHFWRRCRFFFGPDAGRGLEQNWNQEQCVVPTMAWRFICTREVDTGDTGHSCL